MMFKTRVETRFASKLYTKMKFSYVMDDNKFYTCLLNCHSMGQTWVMAQEITHIVTRCQVICFNPNPKVLVVVKCFCLCFHFVHCYESWYGENRNFESITNIWWFWFKFKFFLAMDDGASCGDIDGILSISNGLQPLKNPHVGDNTWPSLQKHEMYSRLCGQLNYC